MLEQRVYLRVREGGFFYLLATGPSTTIEHRSRGRFEPAGEGAAPRAAWFISDGDRIPVYRLGLLMNSRVGQWEYAVVFSDDPRLGIAAAHVHVIPEAEKPAVQPFNPVGTQGGRSLITGVCPGTQPEYLVLDTDRLRARLNRAAAA